MAGMRSENEYLEAAVTFIDEHGLDALTIRSFGEYFGVSHTAIYQHFADKNALITAALERVIGGAFASLQPPPGATPVERLGLLARTLHGVLQQHPNIIVAFTYRALPMNSVPRLMAGVIAELEAMGVKGYAQVISYQLLEDFVVGSSLFNLSSAPDHLESRRIRYRMLGLPPFDEVSRNQADIRKVNEDAFELGLQVLLETFTAFAEGKRTPPS